MFRNFGILDALKWLVILCVVATGIQIVQNPSILVSLFGLAGNSTAQVAGNMATSAASAMVSNVVAPVAGPAPAMFSQAWFAGWVYWSLGLPYGSALPAPYPMLGWTLSLIFIWANPVQIAILMLIIEFIGLFESRLKWGCFVPAVSILGTYFGGAFLGSFIFNWSAPSFAEDANHMVAPAMVYWLFEIERIFSGTAKTQNTRTAVIVWSAGNLIWTWAVALSYFSFAELFFLRSPGSGPIMVGTFIIISATLSFLWDALKHQNFMAPFRQQWSVLLRAIFQGLGLKRVVADSDTQGSAAMMPDDKFEQVYCRAEKNEFLLGIEGTIPNYGPKAETYSQSIFRVLRKAPRKIRKRLVKHALFAAGTREGKGISIVIPNLANFDSSCVAIDPKGEGRDMTANLRAQRGQRIFFISDKAEQACHGFNVFSSVDVRSVDAPTQIRALVQDLISGGKKDESKGGGENPFFDSIKENATYGALVALFSLADAKHLPCPNVQDLLGVILQSPNDLQEWIKRICALPDDELGILAEVAKNQLKTLIGMDEKSWSNVTASMSDALGWLNNPALRRLISEGEFDPKMLLDNRTTLYLNFDLTTLETMPGLAKIIITSIKHAFIKNAGRVNEYGEKPYCLMMIDELPRLGPFPQLLDGLGIIAGYGLIVVGIIQSFADYRRISKNDAVIDIWMDNCTVMGFWAQYSPSTTETLAKMAGKQTVLTNTAQSSDVIVGGDKSSAAATSSLTIAETSRDLIDMSEISRLEPWQMILFHRGMPLLCTRLAYLDLADQYHESPIITEMNLDPNPAFTGMPGTPMPASSMALVLDKSKKIVTRDFLGNFTGASKAIGDQPTKEQLMKSSNLARDLLAGGNKDGEPKKTPPDVVVVTPAGDEVRLYELTEHAKTDHTVELKTAPPTDAELEALLDHAFGDLDKQVAAIAAAGHVEETAVDTEEVSKPDVKKHEEDQDDEFDLAFGRGTESSDEEKEKKRA